MLLRVALILALFIENGSQAIDSTLPLWKQFTPYLMKYPTEPASVVYKALTYMNNSGEAPISLSKDLDTVDWMYQCYDRSVANNETYVVFWMSESQMYCETFKIATNTVAANLSFDVDQMVRVEVPQDRCKYQSIYRTYLNSSLSKTLSSQVCYV